MGRHVDWEARKRSVEAGRRARQEMLRERARARRAARIEDPTTPTIPQEDPMPTTQLVATVHHGDHRATHRVDLPLRPTHSTGTERADAIADALKAMREDPANGIGAYAPQSDDDRHTVARLLVLQGEAERGWVRYWLEQVAR